ncbi:hypothetical protein [Candidatus Shikimatogenerans silvanidophilus]|uniref:hypothetical protein n=1 Tax=Candidatus Shikimatogenerans silvanidophilus TaxID=2782547 RepID=UPI001BA87404|nr:hypothetical protein [Candidatus Shikimatogenerans silvanidophilus]
MKYYKKNYKNIFENFFKKYFYKKIPNSILFLFEKNCVILRLIINLSKKIIQNNKKNNIFNNPDLYFSIPIKNNCNKNFLLKKLEEFVKKNFYNSFYEWNLFINNKSNCFISVEEINSIIKFSYLKSYKGGNKIVIIWMIEKLTISASNKLLKILEQPPKKIYFILIGENINLILPTILSRTYIININNNNFPVKKHIKEKNKLQLIKFFENDFILLIRTIFLLKKNIKCIYFIYPIIKKLYNMEKDKKILFFYLLLEIFRNAYLTNIKLYKLCSLTIKKKKFKWKIFSKKINIYNIEKIMINIDLSIIYINKNFNIKYILINFAKKIRFLL